MSKPQFGEPWKCYQIESGLWDIRKRDGGFIVAKEMTKPIAERIVACVNACVDLSDEQLTRVQAVNEMYEALKSICATDYTDYLSLGQWMNGHLGQMREALALAEGKEGGMKIKHTPGDWHWTLRHSQPIVISGDAHGENTELASVWTSWDDASLMASSQHAPHECSIPDCPGNQNRLKLELWDEMLAALERAEHLLDATVRFVDTNPVKDYEVFFDETMCDATCLADDCGTARDSCQTALAKAKELK